MNIPSLSPSFDPNQKTFLQRALMHSAVALRKRGGKFALAAGMLSLLATGGCSQLAHKERELTFGVVPGTASWYSGLPDGVIEADLPVAAIDGKTEKLHTWWWPSKQRNAPAVLYLHGARWNLTGQLFRIEQLHDFGFSVLAIDYRGFGKSDGGLPSEQSVYQDAQVAWQRLTELQPNAGRRFIYGHSLGGAIAIDLAARLRGTDAARGLIVESTFTSLPDVARSLTWRWLPVQWLMSQKFDSVKKIARVDMPVLVVHGSDDKLIRPALGEKLYAAVRAPKRLLLVDGGTHNNSMRRGESDYRLALHELFGAKAGRTVAANAGS